MVTGGFADLAHQLPQLRRIVIISGEEDQPSHQWMRQNLSLFRIQFIPFNIQHHWAHTDLSYPLRSLSN